MLAAQTDIIRRVIRPDKHVKQEYRAVRPASVRHRRVGRKVLQADRLTHLLAQESKNTTKPWDILIVRPKLTLAACALLIAVSAVGFGGLRFYAGQQAASEKAAAVKEQDRLRVRSTAADACRRKKAEEKADQIGKVTYDELYDGDACDK